MKVYQACVLSTLLYASETIRHALYTHTKSEMSSTCAISDEASCFRQACQACLPSSPRDACPGWDTCAEWKMASSPRTSSMEGSSQESGQLARPTLRYEDVSARRTSRHAASTQQSLRQRLHIEPDSNQRSRMASNCWRRGERTSGKKRIHKRQRLQSFSSAATIPTTGYICGKCHHICIYTAATVAVHLLSQVQMPLSLETKGCQQQIVDVWYQINEILLELQMETKKKHFVFCYP